MGNAINRVLRSKIALAIAAIFFAATPVSAQICNDPSGFVKLKGPIAIGDNLILGPDCQSARDGGVPSGGGGQFIAGRLSLVSGLAVMQTSQAGATTVYFGPYNGNSVPINVAGIGGNPQPVNFTEVSQTTTDTTKSPAAVAPNSCYDMFAWLDAGVTFRVTRGPAWTTTFPGVRANALTFNAGNFFNSQNITNGPSAGNGTYVGTICSNASGSIDYIFGSAALNGGPARFGVWNVSDVDVDTTVADTNSSGWAYNNAGVWRVPNNNTGTMIVQIARGLNYNGVQAFYHCVILPSASNQGVCGVGVGSTNSPAAGSTFGVWGNTTLLATTQGGYSGLPGIGYVTLNPLETNVGSSGVFFEGNNTFEFQSGFHVHFRQ